MSRDEFDALVKQLEQAAERHPRRYVAKVAALAVLAYAYIGLVLLLMLALVTLAVILVVKAPHAGTIKLGFVLAAIGGGMAWAILKGLWVRLSAPEGIRLEPASTPALFELIEDLRTRLRAPPFHEVQLDGNLNAAVVQLPRLGIFGWQRNYLLLGLPLLQGLSPEEFRAVLAHELGHLSASHSRFSGWVYRLRRTWERIFEELARRPQRGVAILTKFLDWFWPRFNAHAFVLSRANEYVADACAAQAAGAPQAALALMRCHLLGSLLDEKFWPDVYRRANDEAVPPADIFAQTAGSVRQPPPSVDSARWLRAGFLLPTTNQQTHPSLTDRLRALGQLPAGAESGRFPTALPTLPGPSAAEAYLGAGLSGFIERLNQQWREAVREGWAARHQEVVELRGESSKGMAEAAELTPEQLWAKAELLLRLEGDAAAMPVIDQLLARQPNHAVANYVRGRFALQQDDPAGVAFLERAMAEDAQSVPTACEQLYAYFARTGQRDRLRAVELRMDAHQEFMGQANAERADATVTDTYMPAGLTAEQAERLRQLCAAEKDVFELHVARKVVKFLPENPFYVLVVTVRPKWYVPRSEGANQKLVERLSEATQLPGRVLFYTPGKRLDTLGGLIAEQPEARVYRRDA